MSGKTAKINKLLTKHASDILRSDGMQLERGFIQHGRITVYAHSKNVAKMSLKIALSLRHVGIKADMRSLVRGALLHDYFLYDWHDCPINVLKPHKMHGFTHAGTALKNAERDFPLTKRERDIIEKHMFPLNLRPPRCREALIVCCADKICAVIETLRR